MKLEYGRDSFELLNGAHADGTVFVIGAGPQLARLTPAQRHALERQVSIGVNKTFYAVLPTYFLSAYVGEVMLALRRCRETSCLHMRKVYAPPLVPGAFPLKRAVYSPEIGLPDRLSGPEPTLYTKKNVVLGATHLALVLGARRVVYVGVEQRNQVHFFHLDETVRETIRSDLRILVDVPFLSIDHDYYSYARQVAQLDRPLEECLVPFYKVDHTPTFREYFAELAARSVEVLTTVSDSVVADAGAAVVSLEEILGG